VLLPYLLVTLHFGYQNVLAWLSADKPELINDHGSSICGSDQENGTEVG